MSFLPMKKRDVDIISKTYNVPIKANKDDEGNINVALSGYTVLMATMQHPYRSAVPHIATISDTTVSWRIYGLDNNLNGTTGSITVLYKRI